MKSLHVKFSKPKYYKTRINPNSKEFYRKHPDLAPRNVYLALGRIVTQEQCNKTIDMFYKELDRNFLKEKVVGYLKQISQKVKQFFKI